MKILNTLIVTFFMLQVANISIAQNKGNSHFFKLIILNDQKEIMLINFGGSWEIPGSRYDESNTMTQFVQGMALDHGVQIKDIELKALVTFHHDVRNRPTMMFYYKSKYVAGELKTPSWGEDVKWFSLEEAYKLIPFQEMVYILKACNKSDRLLTGALTIEYDLQNGNRTGTFKIIEDLKEN